MPIAKQELNRKLLHLLALLMPLGIFYVPELTGVSNWIPPLILFFLVLGSIIMETLRFRYPGIQKLFFLCFGSMLRKEEDKITTGSTYIIGSAFICSILFRDEPHISFMVLILFILGDAAAALVGQSIGKIKIGKKSLEGSLACFIICLVLFCIFPILPLVLDVWDGAVPIPLIIITSFAITLFELVPIKLTTHFILNDNLIVPVIAGFCLKWLYPFFL
jgi:dolichol kinase